MLGVAPELKTYVSPQRLHTILPNLGKASVAFDYASCLRALFPAEHFWSRV